MENHSDYLEVNRELWNKRTHIHVKSEFHEMDAFKSGKTSLKDIELALLGEIADKDILHLQCHFGQDSLSLARMGAKVTGADFSDQAIEVARELNKELKLDARFVLSDVYTLPQVLKQSFDVVYTTYGVLGWLPDMDKWAQVVAHFLKPDGKLVLVEFHPAVWMFDNDFTHVQYSYFNTETIIETEEGTYADTSADINLAAVSWNHPLSEVFSALLKAGLHIEHFGEYDYSPYPCFNKIVAGETGKYYIKDMERKLPIVYSVIASKK